ncbi:MAG: MoaD/ThiS family protein [Bacillota bacterium]
MKLTIKLMPPYKKKGEQAEYPLELKAEKLDLQQLAYYLSREWKERFDFELIDSNQLLTAEFMVNGKHSDLAHVVRDGDKVTVVPYICGG